VVTAKKELIRILSGKKFTESRTNTIETVDINRAALLWAEEINLENSIIDEMRIRNAEVMLNVFLEPLFISESNPNPARMIITKRKNCRKKCPFLISEKTGSL